MVSLQRLLEVLSIKTESGKSLKTKSQKENLEKKNRINFKSEKEEKN